MHFQRPPFAETKFVRVLVGAVLDVFVDLRVHSPTYGQWDAVELSAANQQMVYIPRGFAHGYCTLTPESIIVYKVDAYYSAAAEGGIRWDDPALNIPWPVTNPIVSTKDRALPGLADLVSPFHGGGAPEIPFNVPSAPHDESARQKPMHVRLFKPSVGEEELDAIRAVFDRAWLGLGPTVGQFEVAWSDYIGATSSVGVNSGTAALHLALAAYRFKPGSKVLVPALTFVATAAAVLYNQLEPVFVDADPTTLSLAMEDLDRKTTRDCVAVMPVHFGGHPVPMDRLLEFARAHRLAVIEDCAHCAGGAYGGRKLRAGATSAALASRKRRV